MVRIGVGLTILRISFRISPNPLRALGLLRSVIRERLTLHENAGGYKAVRSGNRYFWSVNVPGWPSDAFDHFILNEFKRINSPSESTLQTIIFAITNICPLDCLHCYESENISSHNRLSSGDLKQIMIRILNKGIKHIQFSGGEPLSRFDDMVELMKLGGEKIDYWINTSGFGFTADKARAMKDNGMTGAIISLDDWDEERHNRFRQNNRSFYWVQEAVKNCNEAGIIACLSVCPSREFVSELNLDLLYSLAKNMGAQFVRILEPRNAGRYYGKDVLLDGNQVETIDRFMKFRNCDPANNLNPIIQFPGHHQRRSGCLGAGNRYIYIDPNGEYHSCPFCRKPLGNAVTESIDKGISMARASGCQAFKQRILI